MDKRITSKVHLAWHTPIGWWVTSVAPGICFLYVTRVNYMYMCEGQM